MLALLAAQGLAATAQHYVPLGGVVDTMLVLPKLGHDSAYLVEDFLDVSESGTLVVEPGCKVYFSQSSCLRVKGGNLLMNGQENDSIYLLCYELSHDWLGVQLFGIGEGQVASLSYVVTVGALSALSATGSSGVGVSHCTFNNYYRGCGIEMVDCSGFVVDSCFFSRCNSGIELKSKTGDCESNRFSHCIFDQGQINIEVSNSEYGFKCRDNVISDNCFQGGATAISFESVGGLVDKEATNYILSNLISSELPQGGSVYSSYGIKAAMDSLVIRNNVFWSNDEAIRMVRKCQLVIEGNTFYDNGLTLSNLLKNGSVVFTGNVVSEAFKPIVSFPSGKARMSGNNFLHLDKDNVLFVNASADDIDISGNYWDVDSVADINAMIFDGNDDPGWGVLVYEERLPECDTTVPISPPYLVKKQWMNGVWRVSWEANPEADTDHYVLFYGNFNYYKFAHHIDSITENHYLLSSQQSENVAVMACDGAYDPDVWAAHGQSAYAFAVDYPYAGEDAEMCAPATGFAITEANIPYMYNRFFWRTSGTGAFSDSLSLQPVYYPSPSDFEQGTVTLTLEVYSQGSVKTDAFQLTLFGQLQVFAGPDHYGGLTRPILLDQAEASHYDSLAWHSLGDGRFDDSLTLNAVYYLGKQDIEQRLVSLVIEAWSYCGYVSDTVNYELFEEFSLEGTTWAKGNPRPQTQVLLAAMNDGNPYVSGFYRTVSDHEGHFRFASLMPDTYILYAFPDTLDMATGGAYYLGRLQWEESNMVLVDGNVYDIDIQLVEVQNDFVGGGGSIRGMFELPVMGSKSQEFYCQPWFSDNDDAYCVDGLSNAAVVLLNATKQRVLGFTLTDAIGRFAFRNLPFGIYHVMADLPRYGRGMVERIELTPEQPAMEDLHLFVDREGRMAMRRQPEEPMGSFSTVYPNPAEAMITVGGLQHFVNHLITVTDVIGNIVIPTQRLSSDLVGECHISVNELKTGVYFVVVESQTGKETLKFVKY